MIEAYAWAAAIAGAWGLWWGVYGDWKTAAIGWIVATLLLVRRMTLLERKTKRAMHNLLNVAVPALQDDKKLAVEALVSIEERAIFDSSSQRTATAALDMLEIGRRGRRQRA